MHVYKPQTKTSGTPQVKPGNAIIARQLFPDELFNRTVILILEHDETGSTGIILNKSNFISRTLSVGMNKDFRYGGTYDSHRIGFIHPLKSISRAIKISEGVYFSERSEELETIFFTDRPESSNIKGFLGFTVWGAGELEQEIFENKWCVTNLKLDELSRMNDQELWGHKLLTTGHIYGLFSNLPDPCLN